MAIKISNSTIIDDSRNIIGAGQANFTGIVTASSYSGSGSNLTGIVTNIASGGGVIASVSNGQASLVVNSLGSSVEQLGILTHPSAYSSRVLFGLGGVASDYDASTIIVNDASVDSNRNIYIFDKSASGYDFVGVVTETYGVQQIQGSDSVMSDDGTIFAVSRRESTVSYSNQIVIWQRTGNTFSGIATITEASVGNGTGSEGFGASFDMSSDGTKFVIGSGANQVAGIGSTDYGTAYVIDRSGSTVTGIATLVGTASTQSSTSAFGVVAMSDDGSTILVGDPVGIHTVNGVDYGGIVYKFTRTGNTVTQVGIITGSRFSTTDRFGGGVEISGDGSRIFVADPNSNVVGAASSSGIVYVYDSNLNEIQQISPHPNTTTGGSNTNGLGFLFRSSGLNYSYGKLLQSSYDGKVLVIGDSDISNFYVYIYDISLNQYILNKEVDFSTGSQGTGWNVAVSGDGTRSFIPDINYLPTGGSAKGAVYYYQNNSSNLLQFGSNIGIGTANPTAKLHIGAATISTAGNAPLKIGAGTTLTTPEVGAIEYDGSYLYQTPNSTSGRAYVPPVYSFRRTTDGSAIGNAIADFFTTPSSLSLEASSVYKITCFAYFTKTTAGTATWTQLFSSAPTIVDGVHYVTPVTGMTAATSATYTQIQQYFYEQGSATFAWNPSATNLTTAVNHFYRLDMTVLTNAATNWRLRLTQSAGTATPLAGSFYTIEKVGPSTGIYAS
jgi:hypothetical protein